MEFKSLKYIDTDELKKFLGSNPARICENTFGVIFMWDVYEDRKYCIEDGSLFLATFKEGKAIVNYPFGGDERAALLKLRDYCEEKRLKLEIPFLSEEQKKTVEETLDAEFSEDRNWDDYLYKSEDLIKLSGKKYHGQKNHLNQFLKNYPDYEYIEYGEDLKSEVLKFYDKYYGEVEKNYELFLEEKKVFLRLLNNYERSGQRGAVIKIGGEVVAVSFGEVVGDTLYVHIEKALREYSGSYAAINKLFAENFADEATFINREEDVGDEGLRTAKLSLHPVELVKKYFAAINCGGN